jgi:hypothetical protein
MDTLDKQTIAVSLKKCEAQPRRVMSEEAKKKISEGRKRYYAEHPEARKQISERLRGNSFHKGHKHSIDTKEEMSRVRKGVTPWNKGIPRSEEERENISKGLGGKNPLVDNMSSEYQKVHKWIRKQLGTPSVCSQCKSETATRYDWANISQEYTYDVKDWKRLCRSCHQQHDIALKRSTVNG